MQSASDQFTEPRAGEHAEVPFVRVPAEAAEIARRDRGAWVALTALVGWIILLIVGAMIDPVRNALANQTLVDPAELIMVSSVVVVAVSATGGWLHNRRSALRMLASSRRGSPARLGARLWVASAFGRRGRASLVRWVHRRRLPPMLCSGVRPHPPAFADVSVHEQANVFTDPRYYPTARPAFSGFRMTVGGIAAYAALQLLAVGRWGWAITLVIAGFLGTAMWFEWRNRAGDFGKAAVRKRGLHASLLIDPVEAVHSELFRSERVFKPSAGLLMITLNRKPRAWSREDPLTAEITVSLFDDRGRRRSFVLIGADNPSIADLGARWLEGWQMAQSTNHSRPPTE